MTDLTSSDVREIGLLFWLLFITFLVIVAAIQKFMKRRAHRNAWKVGSAHPSFWNNDRRGDVECR